MVRLWPEVRSLYNSTKGSSRAHSSKHEYWKVYKRRITMDVCPPSTRWNQLHSVLPDMTNSPPPSIKYKWQLNWHIAKKSVECGGSSKTQEIDAESWGHHLIFRCAINILKPKRSIKGKTLHNHEVKVAELSDIFSLFWLKNYVEKKDLILQWHQAYNFTPRHC